MYVFFIVFVNKVIGIGQYLMDLLFYCGFRIFILGLFDFIDDLEVIFIDFYRIIFYYFKVGICLGQFRQVSVVVFESKRCVLNYWICMCDI